MAACPQCGNSLEQDFGVTSCSNCGAVLFVDMEGQAHISGTGSGAAPPENFSSGTDIPAESESAPDYAEDWMNPGSQTSEPMGAPEGLETIVQEPETGTVSPELTEVQATYQEIEAQSETAYPLAEEELPDLNPEPVAPNDFSDVNNFANSNLSLGPLTYSVIIEDINTKEIRVELKEALSDSKFQWDPSELMKSIKGGRLILKDLNPVKASVLIQRVRDLNVKISWRQNVYS